MDLARHSFSYFTNLTYWGLAFYFFFSALHTVSYVRTGSPLLSRWPRPLQALHSFFYTTVVTFPVLVTVVFWAILYSGPWFPVTFNAWSNVRVLRAMRSCSLHMDAGSLLTIVHTDLSTRPELRLRPLRNHIHPLVSTSLPPPAVLDSHFGIVLSSRLHNQGYGRLLPLWLP